MYIQQEPFHHLSHQQQIHTLYSIIFSHIYLICNYYCVFHIIPENHSKIS